MAEPDRHTALQEASSWFARCRRGVMSVEDRAEFERWRAERRNATAMDEIERAWTRIESISDRFAPAIADAPVRRPAFVRSAVLALICVASLGVGVVSYSGHSGFWTRLDWVAR